MRFKPGSINSAVAKLSTCFGVSQSSFSFICKSFVSSNLRDHRNLYQMCRSAKLCFMGVRA